MKELVEQVNNCISPSELEKVKENLRGKNLSGEARNTVGKAIKEKQSTFE